MIEEKDVLIYLFIFPVTSMSFMKHSILSGRSEELALMSFFSFSHSWYSRTKALGFDLTSSLYLLANSSQKCFTRASSKSFPPSSGSEAVDSIWGVWRQSVKQQKQFSYRGSTQCLLSLRTLSLPLLKAHTDVWYPEWPRSTNTTFLAFSSGAGRSCL